MSLASFITAITTPSGQNARNGQVAEQQGVMNDAGGLEQSLLPLIQQQLNYSKSLEPTREQATNNAIYLASPGSNAARLQALTNNIYSNQQRATSQTANALAGSSMSPSFVAGNVLNGNNLAANNANAAAQQINSPESELAQANGLLQTVAGGQSNPAMGSFGNLASLVYGSPQVPVAPGIGQILGSVVGDLVGAAVPGLGKGLGNLFGGGSSDGGNNNIGFGVNNAGGTGGLQIGGNAVMPGF